MVRLRAPRTAAAEPADRTRRRFARRQWARRWGRWRQVLAVVVLLGVLAALGWLVWFSQVLAVQDVDVEGADLLGGAEVRATSGIRPGEQLARLDLDQARRRVEALAPVRSASVERRWPDGVVITVEEREAVAVVDLGGRLRGMDRDGVVFRDYGEPPPGMPRVRVVGDADRDALVEAASVVSALPQDIAERVDHVDVQTVDQISLVLRDARVVLWGSAEQSEDKARVLGALLAATEARRYDVSVPGQPVTSD